jgi:hypothetical protein
VSNWHLSERFEVGQSLLETGAQRPLAVR